MKVESTHLGHSIERIDEEHNGYVVTATMGVSVSGRFAGDDPGKAQLEHTAVAARRLHQALRGAGAGDLDALAATIWAALLDSHPEPSG